MSYHVRRQIRDAVTAALAGLAQTGSRVFPSRALPLQLAELPCLLVYTSDEQVTPLTLDLPADQQRALSVEIEIIASAAADVDDTLDAIAAAVEAKVFASGRLGRLVKRPLALQRTAVAISGEGERRVGRALLTYQAIYHVTEGAPTAAT